MTASSARTVLLFHSLPDGSSHYDWLIDWPGPKHGEGLLLTFRVAEFLPSLPVSAQLSATRLPDHRRIYLSYEGSISQNRGTVQRVASGLCRVAQLSGSLHIRTLWDSFPTIQLWEGSQVQSDPQLWDFVSLTPPPSADISPSSWSS